ncbi:ABC transporter permease [Puia sp. P3]|uniref:ABC transporter permease n=1 Tax=Puia sp. P3 TaxID=3423952 RepID=UPI003D670A89
MASSMRCNWMLKNFFRVAFRSLLRQKAYSVLNLVGLSLGITCTLLLAMHIREELSYDRNFSKHDRIYRVVSTEWAKSAPSLAGVMPKTFPQIERITHLAQAGNQVFRTAGGKTGEARGFYADSSFPKVFDLQVVAGDLRAALVDPDAVVMTRSTARRFFGDKDPIGQKIRANDQYDTWVKAVVEDMPANTHLQFDYLSSMVLFYRNMPPKMLTNQSWMFGWTYVLFRHSGDVDQVRARLVDFWMKFRSDLDRKAAADDAAGIRLQPVTDIHLHSDLIQEMGPNSSILYIYIFTAVAILILLIACINFVNLFTTQSLKRLKEVAVRKVLGAPRMQVVRQFLGEALLLAALSGLLALVFIQLALPFYNRLTGRGVSLASLVRRDNLLLIGSVILGTGLLSGIFPALLMAGSEPSAALKGTKLPGSRAAVLRKSLVVFQFVASGFLIIATVLVYRQMNLFRNKQLGFDRDQVAIIHYYGKFRDQISRQPEVLKNEFMTSPDILAVGRSSNIIGDDLSVESVQPSPTPEGTNYPNIRVFRVDENYLSVLGIQLKEGRNFAQYPQDSATFIINETAAKTFGLTKPVGSLIENNSNQLQGRVIGVVKDFNFASLHSQIEPLILEYRPKWTTNLLVKIRAGRIDAGIAFLRDKVKKVSPDAVFNYSFLDDHIAGLYRKEDNMSAILKLFTALSIIIACLGLFGLAAYAAGDACAGDRDPEGGGCEYGQSDPSALFGFYDPGTYR